MTREINVGKLSEESLPEAPRQSLARVVVAAFTKAFATFAGALRTGQCAVCRQSYPASHLSVLDAVSGDHICVSCETKEA